MKQFFQNLLCLIGLHIYKWEIPREVSWTHHPSLDDHLSGVKSYDYVKMTQRKVCTHCGKAVDIVIT